MFLTCRKSPLEPPAHTETHRLSCQQSQRGETHCSLTCVYMLNINWLFSVPFYHHYSPLVFLSRVAQCLKQNWRLCAPPQFSFFLDPRHSYYGAVVKCVSHLQLRLERWLRFLALHLCTPVIWHLPPLLGFNGVVLLSYSWTSMIHSKCPPYSSTVIQPDKKKKKCLSSVPCACAEYQTERLSFRSHFQMNCQMWLVFNQGLAGNNGNMSCP